MSSCLSLQGRVALVTGASRGIGRAVALELASRGAGIAIHYRRSRDAALDVVAAVEAVEGRAIAIRAAMGEPQDVDALADGALREFGSVDIIVNNAGEAARRVGVAETYPAEFRRLMTVEAFSAARLAQRLLPQMRERTRGDIVMISSSQVAEMRAGVAAYNMAKAALEALALTLAKEEAAYGIWVNIVAPGLVATDMAARWARAELGLKEIAEFEVAHANTPTLRPQDVARVVGQLVSQRENVVTGQRVVIDPPAGARSGAGIPLCAS